MLGGLLLGLHGTLISIITSYLNPADVAGARVFPRWYFRSSGKSLMKGSLIAS